MSDLVKHTERLYSLVKRNTTEALSEITEEQRKARGIAILCSRLGCQSNNAMTLAGFLSGITTEQFNKNKSPNPNNRTLIGVKTTGGLGILFTPEMVLTSKGYGEFEVLEIHELSKASIKKIVKANLAMIDTMSKLSFAGDQGAQS